MRKKAWVHQKGSRWVAKLVISAALTALALTSRPAFAQTFNSGSTGADGAFNPTTSTTLTLPPDGVFNFTTINIPAGVTVTFTRNPANTPVSLLASGNVIIAGTIDVSGSPGGSGVQGATNVANNGGAGGPGGFDGGDGTDGITSTTGGSGLGPGGGAGAPTGGGPGGGGGFAGPGTAGSGAGGPAYGTPTLMPLIGGSGGGGGGAPFGHTGGGGGGGGGALLIASSGTITFAGTILAKGGQGGATVGCCTPGVGGSGSGGAIRLVVTTITGSGGLINVSGAGSVYGAGSIGRIRVEAFTNTATINYAQVPSIAQPGALALPGTPTLMITSVAGVGAPASPTGAYATPDITLPAGTANPMTIGLTASNIPLGTAVTVTVKPLDGAASSATSTALSGALAASTASASLTIPTNQPSVISASATFTLAAIPGTGPLFAQGEAIEQVRVAAVLGGPSRVVYITRSGREIAP